MTLDAKISEKIQLRRERIDCLKREHGDFVISNVTVEQIYSGIRGVPIQVSDISYVDPEKGVRYQGYTVDECINLLPNPENSRFPYIGGLYYLLMTGELSTVARAVEIEEDWRARSEVPEVVFNVIDAFPDGAAAMAMFSAALLSMSSGSKFAAQYAGGMDKKEHWIPMLDDSMDLIARAPEICAYIYNKKYRNHEHIKPDPGLDYAANFAHMVGLDDPQVYDLLRMTLLLLADHENANVSAHTAHLVGSALSDIYLACSAGLNGLAGPLHGLANQECFKYIQEVCDRFQGVPDEDSLTAYLQQTLSSGRVIPGYGHAVLRSIDPRFAVEYKFGKATAADDPYFQTAKAIFKTAPAILKATGKVKNPWPNVDALTGVLFNHFGLTHSSFYTVLFGLSRLMGFTCHIVWARAVNKPIERPKALTTRILEAMVSEQNLENLIR